MANKYTGSNTGKEGLEVTEADGAPDVYGVTKISVSNGDLTDNGDGSVTIDTSGTSTTPGGSDTQVQYNNSSAFGGISGATTDGTILSCIPTLNIGNGAEEDTKVLFDGNAQDYYVGLDDSTDTMVIGNGTGVSANAWGSSINIDSSDNVRIPLAKVTVETDNFSVDGSNNPAYVGQTITVNGDGKTLTIGDSTNTLPVGAQLVAINLHSSALTISGGTGQTLTGTTSVSQNKAVTLVQVAANTWVSIGE